MVEFVYIQYIYSQSFELSQPMHFYWYCKLNVNKSVCKNIDIERIQRLFPNVNQRGDKNGGYTKVTNLFTFTLYTYMRFFHSFKSFIHAGIIIIIITITIITGCKPVNYTDIAPAVSAVITTTTRLYLSLHHVWMLILWWIQRSRLFHSKGPFSITGQGLYSVSQSVSN